MRATARLAVRFHAVSEPVASDMARRLRVRRDRIVVVPRARRRERARRAVARAALGRPATARSQRRPARRPRPSPGTSTTRASTCSSTVVAALRPGRPDLVALVAGRPGRATRRRDRQRSPLAGAPTRSGCSARRTDVPDLITAADVVVIPSRVEGLPGAVLEAMALERPVIASDIPMVREAIGDDAYALVAVDDVAGFAAAIDRALDDPERHTVAARARRAVRVPLHPRCGRRRASSGSTQRRWSAARWRRSSAT